MSSPVSFQFCKYQTKEFWVKVATISLVAAAYFCLQPLDFFYAVDTNSYLSGAVSLAEGRGYDSDHPPQNPRIRFYPPLQSLYLSIFWKINPNFPENIPLLTLGMFLLGSISLVLFLNLLRNAGLPLLLSVLLTLALGLSPEWVAVQLIFQSDLLFTLLGFALVWLWQTEKLKSREIQWLLTGIGMGLMYLTRTAALVPMSVVLFVCCWDCFKRRAPWQASYYFFPMAVAFLVWSRIGGDGNTYQSFLKLRLMEIGGWPGYLFNLLDQAWFHSLGFNFFNAIAPILTRFSTSNAAASFPSPLVAFYQIAVGFFGLFLIFLAARGISRDWGNKCSQALALVSVAYLLELVFYPYNLGGRGVFILLPILVTFIWKGSQNISFFCVKAGFWKATVTLFVSMHVIVNGYLSSRLSRNSGDEQLTDLQATARWVQNNLPVDTEVEPSWDISFLHFFHYAGRSLFPEVKGQKQTIVPEYIVVRKPWNPVRFEKFFSATGFPLLFPEIYTSPQGYFQVLKVQSAFAAGSGLQAGDRAFDESEQTEIP